MSWQRLLKHKTKIEKRSIQEPLSGQYGNPSLKDKKVQLEHWLTESLVLLA